MKGLTRLAVSLLAVGMAVVPFRALAQLQPANSRTDFYFAQVADGGPASDLWTTEYRFLNPNSFSVTGTLRFYGTDGGPLEVDFGGGVRGSLFSISIPANGSRRLGTLGNFSNLRTGFAEGSFEAPIQATSEFRNWRNGIFANGASVDGIEPNQSFLTYADSFTGIAIANPWSRDVPCVGTFFNFDGTIFRQINLSLGPLNQRSFVLGSFLSLPANTVGSFGIDCAPWEVASMAIAGNDRGISSSLPSGSFALPDSQYFKIQRIFKHLVKSLGTTSLSVGQPTLTLVTDLNAYAIASTNTVAIGLGLAELIADSPSELAHLIGHELGHLYQASHGLQFDSNAELDADTFGFLAVLVAGYDPYGAAGWLGKAMMLTRATNPVLQVFENISSPHTSFSNRMEKILDKMEFACSIPDIASFCQLYRNIFHPHVPGPLRQPPDENRSD